MEPVKFEVFEDMKKDLKRAGLVAWLFAAWQLWFSFLITFVLGMIVNVVLFRNMFARLYWIENIDMISMFFVTILSGLFTILIMGKKCNLSYSTKMAEPKDILTGVALILGANGIFSILLSLISSLFGIDLSGPDLDLRQSGLYNFFLILSVCLAAPIFEEAVFRGMIYKVLSKYNVWMAMVISSLLFGLMHFNLGQGIPAFFMGLVLAGVYAKTDSLIAVMLIHGINNLMATLSTIDSSGIIMGFYVIMIIVCMILTITLGIRNATAIKTWLHQQMEDYPYVRWALKSPAILAFVVFGLIMAILMM